MPPTKIGMAKTRLGDWARFERVMDALPDFPKLFCEVGLDAMAAELRKGIEEQIRTKTSPKLHPLTVQLRESGDAKPLVNRGDLLDSIQVFEVSWNTREIGVAGNYVREDGRPMLPIALQMENGAMLRVTDRMRGWFAAQGFPLRRGTQAIVIPARPFMRPGRDKSIKAVAAVAFAAFAETMRALTA